MSVHNTDIALSMLYNQIYILYLHVHTTSNTVLLLVVHVVVYCTFSEDSTCPGGPHHKLFGFREDIHGHNYVFVVLSYCIYIYIQCCDRNKVLLYSMLF